MSEILVIGGSRFTGKHVLEKLAKNKANKITVINRGNIDPSKYLPEGATHHKIDREDKEQVKEVLEGKSFDIVYDICAITADHIKIVLDVLQKNVKRHVHVSSGSVYEMDPSKILTLPVPEEFPNGPIAEDQHPYMNAKRGAENTLMEAYNKYNYPVTIVRPTFV